MEKILLLNPPGDKQYQRDMYCSGVSKGYYCWPPIDLLVQSGILGQKYDVEILDAIGDKLTPEKCLSQIASEDYTAILFLTGIASWKNDLAFMSRVAGYRKKRRPLIIGNGDILLYQSEQFLRDNDFLDAVLLDYTEDDIIHYFEGNEDKINAFAYRREGKIEIRHFPETSRRISFPIPHHEKLHAENYLLAQGKRFPFTTAMTNFGCPFNCSFCPASVLSYKFRPVDNIMEELRYIASLGFKEIFFTDFTFEAHRKNTLELCRRMIRENLDLSWVCSSRANTLNRKLLHYMKKAGCHTILMGVESGDEKMLRKYSKGVTKDQVREAVSICREIGIRILGHFIIGLPGETEKTVRKTISFAKELDCDIASFNIAVPALGTPLRKKALQEGWLSDASMELDSSASYPVLGTPTFSKEQAWYWQKKAVKEFYFRPAYIWKMAVSSQSYYQWKVLLSNGLALVRNFLFRRK